MDRNVGSLLSHWLCIRADCILNSWIWWMFEIAKGNDVKNSEMGMVAILSSLAYDQ